MGNLSFLVKQKNNFNIKEIKELVEKEFPEYKGEISTQFPETDMQFFYGEPDDYLICDVYIQECYLLDSLGKYTKEYEEEGSEDCIKYEKELMDANLERENSLAITYGYTDSVSSDYRNGIVKFLQKHYNTYWLDEGIHPEYIAPDYFDKKLIKKDV